MLVAIIATSIACYFAHIDFDTAFWMCLFVGFTVELFK